jgi:two-component system chemotaxis response regulator CheY
MNDRSPLHPGDTAMPHQKKLLLVEDDALTRAAFADVLERAGYSVETAGDGLAALDRLRRGALPSCILLDLCMPRMDGRQFRARQLQDPALAHIPVLVVSGEPDVPSEAAFLGAIGFLQKPVDPDDLLLAVRQKC